jgi:hypothetical protein
VAEGTRQLIHLVRIIRIVGSERDAWSAVRAADAHL